jgi:small subunit ribosomal protein S17
MEKIEAAAAESRTEVESGSGSASETQSRARRRTEKVGIVTSDKMMKTVVVRVDRLVKHPIYKRYVRKRSKFMAHSEIEGVTIGDQVRIVETRPLSARKRWRVVEVLRKASK